MRGADVSSMSDVHLFNPSLFPISRCNTCSLISPQVVPYLTVHWRFICSLVCLLRSFLKETFFLYTTGKRQTNYLKISCHSDENILCFSPCGVRSSSVYVSNLCWDSPKVLETEHAVLYIFWVMYLNYPNFQPYIEKYIVFIMTFTWSCTWFCDHQILTF